MKVGLMLGHTHGASEEPFCWQAFQELSLSFSDSFGAITVIADQLGPFAHQGSVSEEPDG
jgi:hypothetical protein